ncbi:hypothetical protein GIB67_013671 [Kingdonia uniflora]|uniref:Uncharacterized protein n=1 Tax=Kingdonia uniflora TaxID=39325 RepID=A0A7J7NPX7_9MAGN|nr:hypothetical protein GIB67_013671 [Kingdonia uniflora]
MRKYLLEKRSSNLKREVLQLIDSDIPFTRDVCSNSTDESKQSPFVPVQPNCKRKDNVACITPRENVPKRVLLLNKMGNSPGAAKTEETDEESSMHAKRSVGRFFYENGIDFSVVKSPSFLKMIFVAVRIRSVRPSPTLENIVLEKENLQKMFCSSAWNTFIWASKADGKRADDLIEGGDSNPQMGYIYETMDQVKETIKEEFENKKTCSGALRYGIQKNLSEELYKIGRNNIEQQRLLDITFVHHNLRLQDCDSNVKDGDGNSDEMIDPMDDWIVDEAVTPQGSVDSVAWITTRINGISH